MKPTDIIRTLLGLAILAAVPCFAATNNELFASGSNYVRECRAAAHASASQQMFTQMDAPQQATAMQCVSYTLGVMHGFQLADSMAYENGYYFKNVPDSVGSGQVMLMTVRFIDQHPEKMHLPTPSLIVMALMEAFPPQPANPPQPARP